MENEIFRAGNYTAKVVRCNTAIVGSGAADVMDGKGSYQAKNDKEFQFFIDPTDDCTYTISAQRSGRTVAFEAIERENWYRIPASEMDRVRQMVEDISYYNAKNYCKF